MNKNVNRSFKPDEESITQYFLKHFLSLSMVDDLAVFLYFLGHGDKALKLLENCLKTDSRRWLYLECLLDSKQYLKCLNLVESMFLKCRPSSMASLMIMKARAYIGLKEYDLAQNLLEDLIKTSPNYLAEDLLQKIKS